MYKFDFPMENKDDPDQNTITSDTPCTPDQLSVVDSITEMEPTSWKKSPTNMNDKSRASMDFFIKIHTCYPIFLATKICLQSTTI